jgi:hypothetical protein
MNQQSREILVRSLSLIKDYRDKKISLSSLVKSLEGSLNAIEENLPKNFYDSWYSNWGDLETVVALGNESEALLSISYDLDKLEQLINSYL